MIYAERHQDIDAGHRIAGHEGQCARLHGHTYRIHFTCEAPELDKLGRVIDFAIIKNLMCAWLEANWDHRFLAWQDDPVIKTINEKTYSLYEDMDRVWETWQRSIVFVPFNPTAENIAHHLLHVVAPDRLQGTAIRCVRVRVDETRKCSAIATLDGAGNVRD